MNSLMHRVRWENCEKDVANARSATYASMPQDHDSLATPGLYLPRCLAVHIVRSLISCFGDIYKCFLEIGLAVYKVMTDSSKQSNFVFQTSTSTSLHHFSLAFSIAGLHIPHFILRF